MADVTPASVLDCKGMQCPLPVIKTAQAIKQIEEIGRAHV